MTASKTTPETDILIPRNPSLDDNSDAWPEFKLTDVDVFDGNEPSVRLSLLEASLTRPVIITGQLQPVPRKQTHLLQKASLRRACNVELSNVVTFSYGLYADGNVGLWACGKAGWFTLKPSRAYGTIWSDMADAVKLLYWIVDEHRAREEHTQSRSAVSAKNWKVEELFEKYSIDVIGEPKAVEGAQEIYRHKEFLLASMITGKEGVAWAKSPLYAHLCKKFPTNYAMIKARVMGSKAKANQARNAEPLSSETSDSRRRQTRSGKSQPKHDDTVDSSSTGGQSKRAATYGTRRRAGSRVMDRSRAEEKPTALAAQSSDSEHDKPRRRMKGRASLRPKSTKSHKGTRRSGKAPIMIIDDSTDDGEDGIYVPAAIRAASKRKYEDDGASNVEQKRRNSKQDMDDDIDTSSSTASSGDNKPAQDEMESGGDEKDVSSHDLDLLQDDTWICALDGCSHKVHDASRPESQRLIREHYALHAYDDDVRVQLVKQYRHPSLPVSHLMERVRLQAKAEGFPGSRMGVGGPNDHSRFPVSPVLRC